MSSTLRRNGYRSAVQRPTVGDTKTSLVNSDHMGWLKCDARALSKSSYPQLFNVLGYSFGGSGDIFYLPDPSGRAMAFVGQATPTGNNWIMGGLSGEETHTLTIAEMPAHNHGTDASNNTIGNGLTGVSGEHVHTGTTNTTGNHTHEIFTANAGASDPNRIGQGIDDVYEGPANTSFAGDHSHTFTTDPSGNHQHTIQTQGGNQPHNNIQPTIWLGYLYIYGGKLFTGSDGLQAPQSKNKFPNFGNQIY